MALRTLKERLANRKDRTLNLQRWPLLAGGLLALAVLIAAFNLPSMTTRLIFLIPLAALIVVTAVVWFVLRRPY